ncbi:N-acetyltransferase family protein [Candidatus Spongiihabitans sp.]|uniref:GNAT family N-acetyltransferase n=1 Tax=Candidatus Spongiihabitans sp. TaxID=3101308 RepID=UPI003C6F4DD9
MDFNIRTAMVDDAEAINRIGNWYIENSAVNFDTEKWSLAQRIEWVRTFNLPDSPYNLLVGQDSGGIIGFACNTRFKPKGAYNTSTETTVYIAYDIKSVGRGGKLYSALMDLIAEQDIHRAYGFITLPNQASIDLHQRLGFRLVGKFDEVGRKFGKYHSIALYQKKF